MSKAVVRKGVVYAVMVLIADAVLIGFVSLIARRNLISYYTILCLVEAGVLFFPAASNRRRGAIGR